MEISKKNYKFRKKKSLILAQKITDFYVLIPFTLWAWRKYIRSSNKKKFLFILIIFPSIN